MFRTAPVAVTDVTVTELPAEQPIPPSHLELDLPVPTTGWRIELDRRGIEVVTDDIGRLSISRDNARLLIAEQRESEARQATMREEAERRAVEADQQFRAQLWTGLPWYELPALDVPPVVAMTAAAHDAQPRRRSLVTDLLDNPDGGSVYHPIQGEEAES
jgi:hypothetical protein